MKVPIDLAPCATRGYTVAIEPLPTLRFDTKVAIVSNPTVAGFHLDTLLAKIEAPEVETIIVPDGEAYKTMETVEEILDALFQKTFDRKSKLIAFGGGVIGDMTGFAASIYQRGIGFIQIPTTLLAQVDASVGGKTGINNRYGKNLVGAFYQPEAVYIDTAFLKTLPEREFAAGVAEIVKMAVMFDADFFAFLESVDLRNDNDALQEAIKRSVETKARVVAEDEKEAGIRAVLNYGHTFAHVIENRAGYGTLLHGEAVAIGMVMANALAQKLGLLEADEAARVERVLERYALPVSYPLKDANAFYEQFFFDKKTANGTIKFILPKGIGDFVMRDDIAKETVVEILQTFAEGER